MEDSRNLLKFDDTGTIVEGCLDKSVQHVVIPEGVREIGDNAFMDCQSLISIEIPNSVKVIRINAFYGCCGLTEIEIPNSVEVIEREAFVGCYSLTIIAIPSSVIEISYGAFCDCTALKKYIVSKDNLVYQDIEGVLFSKDGTLLHTYPTGNRCSKYSIPNCVAKIGAYAFFNCIFLTSIEIPNSVTEISNGAFSGCHNLISISIPNSVKCIRAYAFANCFSLSSISIPKSVKKVDNSAFYECYFIAENFNNKSHCVNYNWSAIICDVNQDDGLLIMDKAAVCCRKWATCVTIPNSVTRINYNAFSHCRNLSSVTIPNSVTSIGGYAFEDCSSLKEIHLGMDHPENIEIGWDAFEGIENCLLYVPIGTGYAYRHDERFKMFKEIRIEK